MKRLQYHCVYLSGIIFIALFVSCGKKDPQPTQSEAEKATALLSGAWKLQTVTVDGTDQTDVYKGLTLGFAGTSYTTINGGIVWPASGSWKFTDDTASTIERSDGLKLSLQQISETGLTLGLSWPTTSLNTGRTSSLKGSHTFVFGK